MLMASWHRPCDRGGTLLLPMILDSFRQDVRVGFRVLFKEKAFCILAVTVLALGICGVTTQFTVVNAFLLRGFSFPNPHELMNVGLLDPQANQNQNNGGLGFIPTAQDYEDLREGQKSFALIAGYLNGSTINVTHENSPQRYTGGYVTEDFFKIIGVNPILGRDFTAADNRQGAEKVALARPRDLAAGLRRRPGHRGAGHPDQWEGGHDHRGDAERVQVPGVGAALGSLLQ